MALSGTIIQKSSINNYNNQKQVTHTYTKGRGAGGGCIYGRNEEHKRKQNYFTNYRHLHKNKQNIVKE